MMGLYFISLVLPEPLRTEVQELKESWAVEYGVRHALNSPPHITIVPPFSFSGDERELRDKLVRPAAGIIPFPVSIFGFGSFPKRVIYLRPQSPDLNTVHQTYQQEWSQFTKKGGFPFTPHITLAHRDLSPDNFDRIWQDVSGKGYHREFLADRIALLCHDGEVWKIRDERVFGGVDG